MKKNIEKVLFINPPGTIHVQLDGRRQMKESPLPLGLAYLSAQISKDYDVRVYDMIVENFFQETIISEDTILFGDTFEQYESVLKDYKPDLVAITCMLSSRSKSVLELLKRTKQFDKEITTVVGGYHATALPEHILQENTDFILFGEADYSFPKLVNTLNENKSLSQTDGIAYKINGKLIIKPQTIFVKDLDYLPFPDWDTVEIQKYWNNNLPFGIPLKNKRYAVMNTSRGCPHVCNYCAVPNHTGKRNYRKRSLDNVINEIQWLVDKYGVKEIQFLDDNFFVSKKRTKDLCKILISDFKGMHFAVPTGTDLPNLDYELIDLLKEANFHDLRLGIETGDKDIQNRYVDKKIDLKNIKDKVKYIMDADLKPSGFFLLGFPDETKEQIEKTVNLATSLDLDRIYLIMVTPLPGSPFYDDCIKNNLLYDDFDVTKLRYSNTFIKNSNISREQLEGIRRDVWRDYMSKRIDINKYDKSLIGLKK